MYTVDGISKNWKEERKEGRKGVGVGRRKNK